MESLLRCHKCGKLGHTANKCRSSEKFPHTRAWKFNEFTQVTVFTEVMICFNCGRDGHFAKNCRQGSVCRKCGMGGHTEINCRVLVKVGPSRRETNAGRSFATHELLRTGNNRLFPFQNS